MTSKCIINLEFEFLRSGWLSCSALARVGAMMDHTEALHALPSAINLDKHQDIHTKISSSSRDLITDKE